jgi:hypothetical protein
MRASASQPHQQQQGGGRVVASGREGAPDGATTAALVDSYRPSDIYKMRDVRARNKSDVRK